MQARKEMKGTTLLPKKNLSLRRVIDSLIKGILLGWIFSLAMTLYAWHQCGFNTANERLLSMLNQESGISSVYSDTVLYSEVMAFIHYVVGYSSTVKTSIYYQENQEKSACYFLHFQSRYP